MANLINIKKSSPTSSQQHYNPFWPIQSALSRAIDDFYNVFDMPTNLPTGKFEGLTVSPLLDIVDDKNSYKVEAEMPGIAEDDIKVTISKGILTIKGEKKAAKEDKDKDYIMREINYGSYERRLVLPDSVEIDKANASFKNGILCITIPKKAESAKKSRGLKIEKSTN